MSEHLFAQTIESHVPVYRKISHIEINEHLQISHFMTKKFDIQPIDLQRVSTLNNIICYKTPCPFRDLSRSLLCGNNETMSSFYCCIQQQRLLKSRVLRNPPKVRECRFYRV